MKIFLFIAAVISAGVGLLALMSIKSDVQIIISLIGFGFAVVFVALARIVSATTRAN